MMINVGTLDFYKGDKGFKLLSRRGVYPCVYMDSQEKFDKTKLPLKNAFYSKLNIKGINFKGTASLKNVTLGHYCGVYLAKDFLLLEDESETLQNTCLKHYKLYPADFYRASGLAWQALLKTPSDNYELEAKHKDCKLCLDQLKLELLTDLDILLFEKGIKGGITQAFAMSGSTTKNIKD